MSEPYYADERTKTALGGRARVLLTATNNWIVQYRLQPTDEKWWYADSDWWLKLTPEEFLGVRLVYTTLRNARDAAANVAKIGKQPAVIAARSSTLDVGDFL